MQEKSEESSNAFGMGESSWQKYIAKVTCPVNDDDSLDVLVHELVPFYAGELHNDSEIIEYEYEDHDSGNTVKGSLECTHSIHCELVPEANRSNPKIVFGERVIVYHNNKSDEWFYEPTSWDIELRPIDTVRYFVPATGERNVLLDDDNTYYFELDSAGKRVVLSTSKANGEKFRYQFEIDADGSTATMSDDSGNFVRLESEVPRIKAQNRMGTMIDMVRRDIVSKAPRQMIVQTPIVTSEVTGGSGVSVTNSKSSTVNCKDTYAVDAPSIAFKGSVIVEGPLQAKMLVSEGGLTVTKTGAYGKATSSPKAGTANNPANTPNNMGPAVPQRHCAAWEDTDAAFNEVAAQLNKLASCTGCSVDTSGILANSKKSKMIKNQGE